MNSDELKKRTQQFALRVLALSDALPRTPSGRVIAYQLVKSGTSVGANYRELIIAGEILPAARVQPLHEEANELTAIFTTSLKSARRNAEA